MSRFKGWNGEAAKRPKQSKPKTAGLTGIEAVKARRNAVVLIGIDPGVNTGIAVRWKNGTWTNIDTTTIFDAITTVKMLRDIASVAGDAILVRIEDARQRTWFGDTDRERLKGAGSVERDCKIWEEVLTELKIPFEFVHPKHVKEATEEMTGWKGRTSVHSREAAWLIL